MPPAVEPYMTAYAIVLRVAGQVIAIFPSPAYSAVPTNPVFKCFHFHTTIVVCNHTATYIDADMPARVAGVTVNGSADLDLAPIFGY